MKTRFNICDVVFFLTVIFTSVLLQYHGYGFFTWQTLLTVVILVVTRITGRFDRR